MNVALYINDAGCFSGVVSCWRVVQDHAETLRSLERDHHVGQTHARQEDSHRDPLADVPAHIAPDHNLQHDLYAEYDLHNEYHHMRPDDAHTNHQHEEAHALLYEHMDSELRDAHTQPEHGPEHEAEHAHVETGSHAEAGELPPEESLRIHKLRRRTPVAAAAVTSPDEEQETLS
jgi:hypothetical protein